MIYFWIVFALYWIHRIGVLPYCPFCSIHISFIRLALKASIHIRGRETTYHLVQLMLSTSTVSQWIIIYDELTNSNYEEKSEETSEQVTTSEKITEKEEDTLS